MPPVEGVVIQRGPLNGVRLDWQPVTHSITGQPVEAVSYLVYGATASEGPFVPFGYAADTTYIHPYITNSQLRYFYFVTALPGAR